MLCCAAYSALIWSNKDMHSTPIRAMGFNSIKTNVLATGASNGEVRANACKPFRGSFGCTDLDLGPCYTGQTVLSRYKIEKPRRHYFTCMESAARIHLCNFILFRLYSRLGSAHKARICHASSTSGSDGRSSWSEHASELDGPCGRSGRIKLRSMAS